MVGPGLRGSPTTSSVHLSSRGCVRRGSGPTDACTRVFYASEHVFAEHAAPGRAPSSSDVATDEPPLLLACGTRYARRVEKGQKGNWLCFSRAHPEDVVRRSQHNGADWYLLERVGLRSEHLVWCLGYLTCNFRYDSCRPPQSVRFENIPKKYAIFNCCLVPYHTTPCHAMPRYGG